MRRRELLATTAIALLAGCTGSPGSDGSGDTPVPTATATPGTDTPEPTATPTWSPGGTAEMGPDSNLVRLTVEEGYAGEVVLGGTCADDVVVGNGETVRIERESPGEGCSYTITLNGTVEARDGVSGSETARITVTADGEVEVSELMV